MSNENFIKPLEEKLITNFDFLFLQEISEQLPYKNAYFLVCLVEILNQFINEERVFDSYDHTFQSLIAEASELYLSINISERLNLFAY